jgi:sulfhydrogenase subunit beta (sulfur reductase)
MRQDIAYLPRSGLQELLDLLAGRGYRCIGPQVRDGAIVYDDLESLAQMPRGIRQLQSPGNYRLQEFGDDYLFAWANGPQALKPLVFASEEILWQCRAGDDKQLTFTESLPAGHRVAFIGARPCDIAALYIHDSHFLQQDYRDAYYLARRQNMFLIAVNCTHPADTCFCASTGDGPRASYGYDLALTELEDGFLLECHSESGQAITRELNLNNPGDHKIQQADALLEQAAVQQRRLPEAKLQAVLFDNLEHPRWQEVAERCLSCGNCTAVCPTCFCHRETEQPQLDGSSSVRLRQWDSCFTPGHSYIHGITIRADTRTRYRQWLTHKLGSWHEQYGRSGCVGCGRCITWCPVGIDLTEEVAAICTEATS